MALMFSLAALSSPSICFAKVSLTHSLTEADLGKRETCPGLVEVGLGFGFVLFYFFLINLMQMSSFSWRS